MCTKVKMWGVKWLFLLLWCVSGSVWGQEVTYVFESYDAKVVKDDQQGSWKTSIATSNANQLPADFSETTAKGRGVAFGGNADIVSNFEVKNVTDLVVESSTNGTGNSLSVKVGTTVLSPQSTTLPKVNHKTYSFKSNEPISGVVTISIKRSASTVWIGGVMITSVKDNQVSTPVFTPADGTTFDESLNVKATCATDGATIHYTTNGDDPTAKSDVLTENGIDITETTTVKAIAVKEGLDNSSVVTATYTKIEPFASLAELKEKGGATAAGVPCMVKLTDAVVTYAEDGKAYIQDATGGLYIYYKDKNNKNKLVAGTKLNGVVSAKLALFNGLYELMADGGEFDAVEKTEGVEIPVQEVTLAELTAEPAKYESMRIKVVDATVVSAFSSQDAKISQNGTTFALRAVTADITADVNSTIDVVGYPTEYQKGNTGAKAPQITVLLQEDITKKSAGKTQATLAFEKESYTVDLNGIITVNATTNSTSPIVYSSSDEDIAIVIEESCEVKVLAGDVTGTVTITATVAENDEFTGATATCTVKVIDPSALPEAVALVSEKDGVYYAMLNTTGNSSNKLNASVATVFNGKVITDRIDLCGWYADKENGTIQHMDMKQYVAHGSGNTDLKLQSNSYKWIYLNGMWQCTVGTDQIAVGLNSSEDKETGEIKYFFGTYLVKDIDKYPAPVAMSIANGYHRENLIANDYLGTICLPYAVSAGDFAGAEFYSIVGKVMNGEEAQYMKLEQVTELEAGVPYIFSATSDKLVVVYSGEAVTEEQNTNANGLVGSFAGQAVAEGMYLINDKNQIKKCGTGCRIAEYRAYINMNDVPKAPAEVAANQRLIKFEDATGIASVVADENELVDVYTMSGVEMRHQVRAAEAVKDLPRGIYIVKGQKIIVK